MLDGYEKADLAADRKVSAKKIVLAALFLMVLLIVGIWAYLFFAREAPPEKPLPSPATTTPTLKTILPAESVPAASSSAPYSNIKAEDLLFGYFYSNHDKNNKAQAFNYGLPINVKIDVANYYDISRQIDFDKSTENINKYGFAVIKNPFAGEADNFFDTFALLRKKNIPVLLTSDFMLYYYQNTMKEAYKDIEADVFYKALWEINNKLFMEADAAYRNRKKLVGQINEPVLEGLRREAAFFAVALELLKPKANQVNSDTVIDGSKFSISENEIYSFSIPEYLTIDAKKEYDYIKYANQANKSPIFLYQRDYRIFSVPDEYKTNSKLNNFYLASRWMNSQYPLFYKDKQCPDCLLDQYDWRIDLMAAFSIARHFHANQEIKNKWARIYKVIAYFNGLRSDLTYLQYEEALREVLGDNYDLDKTFSNENPDRDRDLDKLQRKLTAVLENRSSDLEGGLDRYDPSARKNIGMRVLQEAYWPDDHIFGRLVYPYVTSYGGMQRNLGTESGNLTNCNISGIPNRCNSFGLDIVNLIYPLPASYGYFQENTNYDNYTVQMDSMREQLKKFSVNSWHSNIFWTVMDMNRKLLDSYGGIPGAWEKDSWQAKNVKTALGSWVNLQVPADKYVVNQGGGKLNEENFSDDDYVEPNLVLVNELIANTDMVQQMLLKLEVNKTTDLANLKLNSLLINLKNLRSLIVKEINKEEFDYNDKKNLADLVNYYSTVKNKKKRITIENISLIKALVESIDGVNIELHVYQKSSGRKVMVAGPVFNYQELW